MAAFQTQLSEKNTHTDSDWENLLRDNASRQTLVSTSQNFRIFPNFGLTARETEVLQELAEGYTQKEIADRLYVSRNTVNTHIQNIYGKMDVSCAPKAVAIALRNHVIK